MTRVVWNEARLAALLNSEQGEVASDLLRRAVNVESQAKLNASGHGSGPRVRTGRLRASIRHQLDVDERGLVARIGSNVEYARYVEEGTEPHRISAGIVTGRSRKRALHWKGARHPVLTVNHPGNRAYPYLRPALVAARQ
jgi:bacteriophage HK97-gp10 putative tail-component